MPPNKKKKLGERAMRGTRAAKALVKGTQDRVSLALGKLELGSYDTNALLVDAMEQWTDVLDAFWRPAKAATVPSVHFISNAAAPDNQTVALSESVKGGLITLSDLTGVAKVGVNAVPVVMSASDYRLRHPDDPTQVITGATQDELDEVVVEIVNMPTTQAMYRGVLRSGHIKVLAEVVVVRV